MFTKKISSVLLGAAMAMGGTGVANAGFIDSYLVSGANVFEDDSNEYLFRADANSPTGYTLLTSGTVQAGDLFVQMFDWNIVNGVNIDSAGREFTGVGISQVTSVGNVVNKDFDGAGPLPAVSTYDSASFGSASASVWQSLLGIDITALGFDSTGLFSLLFQDPSNNLDLYADGLANVGKAMDGTLALALSISGPGNYAGAIDTPTDITTFILSPGETAGVTQYGQFNFNLNVAYEDLSGNISDITGSGTNLVTDRQNIAVVIDDTQFSFVRTVPEPSSIALLGLGMLGFAARSRRSSAV